MEKKEMTKWREHSFQVIYTLPIDNLKIFAQ
jgi:hypothetical protein